MKRLPVIYSDSSEPGRSPKSYWRSLGEQQNDPEFHDAAHREFPEGASEMSPEEGEVSRRNFLTVMGASIALAGLAACRRPEEHIVPYARPPEELIPGKPLYYATSVSLYGTAMGVLVESHEGRPTKIEGNPRHPESLGATTTFLQAMVLDMYDPDRSGAPHEKAAAGGALQKRTWDDANKALRDLAAKVAGNGGKGLAIVTEAHRSPTLSLALADLKKKLPEARIVRYEPFARSNAHEGHKLAFGRPLGAVHALDKAMVIATFDSDAFYAESSPIKNARQWAANRDPEGGRPLNRMYAVESVHSVTGANADHRLRATSRDVGQALLAVAQKVGVVGAAPSAPLAPNAQKFVDALAADLLANRGKSVVMVGDRQPPVMHAVGAAINKALGNDAVVSYVAPFDDTSAAGPKAIVELAKAIEAKQVDTVVLLGGNPAFNAPADAGFAKALAAAPTSVHLSTHLDETSALCTWHLNRTHFLEAWDDTRAEDGTYAIVQPLIAPLYDGRTDAEIVRALIGDVRKPYELVRESFAKATAGDEAAWKRALHDGFVANTALKPEADAPDVGAIVNQVKALPAAAGLEVTFLPDGHAYDGRFANNGWLLELPEAMTKLTWGSSVWVSAATAKELAVKEGDTLTVTVDGVAVTLPVVIAPGQADKSLAVMLGLGRKKAGRVGDGVGIDTFPAFKSALGFVAGCTAVRGPTPTDIPKTASMDPNILSRTQEHFNMEGRPIVRETTPTEYASDPQVIKKMTPPGPPLESLWYDHKVDGHKWGMTIDLGACIGCNACMVACQAENNVPVVGVLGVRKSREMHWLRIDRYFEGTPDDPRSVTMPLMCQQCETAPCEQVCPVGATMHSPEGLNDMSYNRCIGTRYCANNCPYKVRRFNFFNYSRNFVGTQQMQLNPNVSVRARGVMEKCTWCVQRINEAKIDAKKNEADGRVRDGAIVTACQQACPTRAIVFGDYNDRESMVSKKANLPRSYALLAEFNFRPRLQYLAKVRNPNPALEPAKPAAAGGHGAAAAGHAGEPPHAPAAPEGAAPPAPEGAAHNKNGEHK
ncbi:MAG: TAT-variant-translocated molybdopterin oxidoreductase [Deltaproteobacteria bacterium]|nr:TAT-variant-translocated molybdopterin oxidoreductase [Deltaproteobacteria bacterium]